VFAVCTWDLTGTVLSAVFQQLKADSKKRGKKKKEKKNHLVPDLLRFNKAASKGI
jgi:hypothetical protein